jgi:hypothetical protein
LRKIVDKIKHGRDGRGAAMDRAETEIASRRSGIDPAMPEASGAS